MPVEGQHLWNRGKRPKTQLTIAVDGECVRTHLDKSPNAYPEEEYAIVMFSIFFPYLKIVAPVYSASESNAEKSYMATSVNESLAELLSRRRNVPSGCLAFHVKSQ